MEEWSDMKSPTSVDKNDVLKLFIENYESCPELWNKTSPMYVNKYKRKLALEKLLTIYKQIKPDATLKDVTKKN